MQHYTISRSNFCKLSQVTLIQPTVSVTVPGMVISLDNDLEQECPILALQIYKLKSSGQHTWLKYSHVPERLHYLDQVC